ncbi:molecular chaperone HtpG [Luteibaculum oceani]|uniref:Chaperone protein HtpG n=1 Tax=Luteibaculum oceani TaxID=1294296 RepID=A0A5C6VAS7_9FLAO|nr:molecular chaperone HtpG [Luteibaculum oceani]TXC81960.1 molecular chaperone HtpG [Luteibaculum oceani]
MQQTGNISVQTENIFPIIKKALYSDHEIFLRELVSNGVDACQKLKTLAGLGETTSEIDKLRVEVAVDKKKKTITISDNGIGMTAEEVDKYINQIAFSGAEEFVNKYKDKTEKTGIIGHFGLGFYSAFMVAEKVEIHTKSHTGADAVKWTCDGSTSYSIDKGDKKERGTEITLFVDKDSEEFLEDHRISGILEKYCKFLPVEIKFGTKEETKKEKDGDKEKETKVTVDNIINNPNPAWVKAPADLKEEDYKSFFRELYPFAEEPLFHIHLNVDYPFNLTGVLYFPKLKNSVEVQKNKIQLYCNQVFVTDSVEGVVPEFLTLLQGVLDSPDIPLNVSRSYLQSDSNVKKISNHITKKVADKLNEIYKNSKEDFESKWEDIKVFIEYGMLSEDKFYDRIKKIFLVKDTEGKHSPIQDFIEEIKATQTNKNKKTVVLYTHEPNEHHIQIEAAKNKGYKVVVMDSPLTSHVVSFMEQKLENVTFSRIDADSIDKLIEKDEEIPSKLSKEEEEKLKPIFEGVLSKDKFTVEIGSLEEQDQPVIISQPEFMRRMKEQQMMGGGAGFYGTLPEMYSVKVNGNHPIISSILAKEKEEEQKDLAKQVVDLALLSQNLLKGEDLSKFIKRSVELIKN